MNELSFRHCKHWLPIDFTFPNTLTEGKVLILPPRSQFLEMLQKAWKFTKRTFGSGHHPSSVCYHDNFWTRLRIRLKNLWAHIHQNCRSNFENGLPSYSIFSVLSAPIWRTKKTFSHMWQRDGEKLNKFF